MLTVAIVLYQTVHAYCTVATTTVLNKNLSRYVLVFDPINGSSRASRLKK